MNVKKCTLTLNLVVAGFLAERWGSCGKLFQVYHQPGDVKKMPYYFLSLRGYIF